nr:CBL-interacting serine/threonine-protein kinase 1-like [Ipomoea batatas]
MMLTAIAVHSSADADAQIQTTLQLAAIRHSKSKQEVASCRPRLPSRSAIADRHFPPTVEFSCLFVSDDCHAKTPTAASTGIRLLRCLRFLKHPHRSTQLDHIVVILRGLPGLAIDNLQQFVTLSGSGKSYLAKMLHGHEVLASKTKICMVLQYVNGGELFDRIVSKGKLPEVESMKLFQQLIDGVSYCHSKGVFHKNLKLENVLVDENGIIKVTDFGLSALPQHFRDVSERKIIFKSNLSPKELLVRIENTVINMGFQVQRKNGKDKQLSYFLLNWFVSAFMARDWHFDQMLLHEDDNGVA